MPDIGGTRQGVWGTGPQRGPGESLGRGILGTKSPKSCKLFRRLYYGPKIPCFATQCVVGICECVVGFCEIVECSRIFGQNAKSLIILSTATGENRFVLALWTCNFK